MVSTFRYQGTVHSAHILTKIAHNLLKHVNRKPHRSTFNNKNVKSPIPGLVKKVLCNTGDYVMKGDQLCIVGKPACSKKHVYNVHVVTEAMKMQNFIHSTSHGKVKKVLVTAGLSVGEGDVVVIFE